MVKMPNTLLWLMLVTCSDRCKRNHTTCWLFALDLTECMHDNKQTPVFGTGPEAVQKYKVVKIKRVRPCWRRAAVTSRRQMLQQVWLQRPAFVAWQQHEPLLHR